MILQIYNRLRRISIKIQYGTTLISYYIFRAVLLGCVVWAVVWLNLNLQTLLGESQESIIHSRKLNVTHTLTLFYCDLPYDDCLCPVLSNISNTSEKCITNVQLVGNRILPLISFPLQIFLVRELFSLSGDHRHVIIYALWIVSIIIYICMTVTIYWSICYHAYTTLILYLTGASLCILSSQNMMASLERMRSVPDRNIVVTVHKSERTNNAGKSSQELLTLN